MIGIIKGICSPIQKFWPPKHLKKVLHFTGDIYVTTMNQLIPENSRYFDNLSFFLYSALLCLKVSFRIRTCNFYMYILNFVSLLIQFRAFHDICLLTSLND